MICECNEHGGKELEAHVRTYDVSTLPWTLRQGGTWQVLAELGGSGDLVHGPMSSESRGALCCCHVSHSPAHLLNLLSQCTLTFSRPQRIASHLEGRLDQPITFAILSVALPSAVVPVNCVTA